ncbi:OmpA family protein [Maribacter sp. BPC-D8]|uniref:OmpA family protein n=1 Tax=unclassified Maribacter TaxID=2615042 RepID=UPI002B48AC24|nr:OmpA family protein [Maribacter sp. BPC-D8]WRI28561.1 OmpA family protein [Maribacter sp. BPC-D8]
MGKILRIKKLTTLSELIIAVILLGGILGAVYYFAPGLRVGEAKVLEGINVDKKEVNNVITSAKMELPSKSESSAVEDQPLVRIAAYAWNAQSGIIVANGGPKTTKGSLMEQNGVNLEIIRQDWLSELRNMQMKFVEEYDRGEEFPDADKSAFAIIMMGDGAPFYISTMQQALDDKFGKDKYHVQVVGAVGISYGEDKLIGPPSWKVDPKSMKGALISTVLGDGDWVTALNYAFANGLKVNPDSNTYDPEAVNFYPSQDDDYIKSAEELIKSQKSGWTVPLKEVKNGKLTGKTINKKIDGCATWTPGDKMVFDALSGFTDIASTKEFNNQMATTVIAVKEWSVAHPKIVSNILKSALTASNQMKQYDEWQVRASEAVAETYDLETPKYWYDMFKGQKGSKNGIDYNMGGSRVFNYSDVMQYYGITDGTNRYKAVYNQVSSYLLELNPFGFNESVKRIVPYDEAVNLYFIKNINDIESGTAYKADYTKEATEVLASGEWNISFDTGSANISASSASTLESIYNLLVQAEDTKLKLEGHTDDTGSAEANYDLSQRRAQAVVTFLRGRGIPQSRFQTVIGKGEDEPVAANTSNSGRAKNRRVVIELLK